MDNLSNPLNLLASNMCSPMVIFVVYFVVSAISMYMTHTSLKKYNTQKMENLFYVHLCHEIKFLIVLGVVIYGLCQYNQVTLAWVFLIFPVIYVLLKNILVYVPVSTAKQNTPTQVSTQPSQNILTQVNQAENDKERVIELQKNMQMQNDPPKVEMGTAVRSLGGMNGGGSGLSPPLNSSVGGMEPMGNMAGF